MSKLMVFAPAYHDGNGCTHDVVRLDTHAHVDEPHDAICLLCELPVTITDSNDFAAMYEPRLGDKRGGMRATEYHRCWAPECPECGAAMSVWSGGKGWALGCVANENDDCPTIGWSDTLIGLHDLHAEAMKEATR